MGPNASPKIYMLRPRIAMCDVTPKSLSKSPATGLKPLAPQDTLRSMGMMEATIIHFRSVGQFRGSSGSSGPKTTIFVAASEGGNRASFSPMPALPVRGIFKQNRCRMLYDERCKRFNVGVDALRAIAKTSTSSDVSIIPNDLRTTLHFSTRPQYNSSRNRPVSMHH